MCSGVTIMEGFSRNQDKKAQNTSETCIKNLFSVIFSTPQSLESEIHAPHSSLKNPHDKTQKRTACHRIFLDYQILEPILWDERCPCICNLLRSATG